MAWADALRAAPEHERPVSMPRTAPTGGTSYGRAALRHECEELASTAPGGRNDRLNRAAFSVAQLVAGGEVDPTDAHRELMDAARRCGLDDREIRRTIASGWRAGASQPRQAPPREVHPPSGPRTAPPPDAYVHTDDDAPDAPPRDEAPSPRAERAPLTIASVLDAWRAEGPLVHEPTGIARLDELTGGGPVYGTRWYLAGAPDAGKTALLVQIAHEYAARGITVGLLAVDEEPSDLVTRFVQRMGHPRYVAERRPADALDRVQGELGGLPLRLYDASWTIEAAATDLAKAAQDHGDGRAMLGIDSLQTVTCEAEQLAALAGREMGEVAAVTARTKAIRAAATTHRLIAICTSELGRSAYRSRDPDQQTSTLAASKWSGAVEYSARVLLGIRSVAGESDVLDVEIAKNKHGPRDEHVFLRIDRKCQALWEVDYQAPPTPTAEDRAQAKVQQTRRDAAVVARVLVDNPGVTVRTLRARVGAQTGMGKDRLETALEALGPAVVRTQGARNANPMTLDLEAVPSDVRALMEASHQG